jgi:hypothetical protein
MPETTICPVAQNLRSLKETLQRQRITVPRAQQRAESLLELMEDVSRGRGGSEHFAAMESLTNLLLEGEDEQGVRFGQIASRDWSIIGRYMKVTSKLTIVQRAIVTSSLQRLARWPVLRASMSPVT